MVDSVLGCQSFWAQPKSCKLLPVFTPDPVNIESDENKNLRKYANLLRICLRSESLHPCIFKERLYCNCSFLLKNLWIIHLLSIGVHHPSQSGKLKVNFLSVWIVLLPALTI